jgi:hypothetical protein
MGHNFYHFAAAKKNADAFEVSMNYFVGEGSMFPLIKIS